MFCQTLPLAKLQYLCPKHDLRNIYIYIKSNSNLSGLRQIFFNHGRTLLKSSADNSPQEQSITFVQKFPLWLLTTSDRNLRIREKRGGSAGSDRRDERDWSWKFYLTVRLVVCLLFPRSTFKQIPGDRNFVSIPYPRCIISLSLFLSRSSHRLFSLLTIFLILPHLS